VNAGCDKSSLSSDFCEIKALIFDAGDILYFRPQRGRFFKAFLKKNNIEESLAEKDAKEKLKILSFHGEISREQLHERLLELYGISELGLMSKGKQALEADENDISFFEGVPQTLESLKARGYLLGILTDTANPLSVKLGWFEKGGFGNVWDSIISSHDLGVQKPDAQMYQAVLLQMGVQAHQAIFIGHDKDELKGAHDLGMRTVAFNNQEKVTADYYIGKFSDLIEIPCLTVEKQKDVSY
jgi:putative hydrolase of the HAD superfamily